MNAREQAQFDAVKRVGTFGTNHASDFTTIVPPAAALSPGQNNAKLWCDQLNSPGTGLIARIAANATSQQSGSGDFHGGTTSKSVQREGLMLELKQLNRTAAAIAKDKKEPGIMDDFRLPHGVGDAILCARARAMIAAAQEMATDFVALGYDPAFAADLEARVASFEHADDEQNTGAQGLSGATAAFGPLLQEAMTIVAKLDAFVHNFYKGNAAVLAEWHAASHVERQARAAKDNPAPAKPPQP